MRFHRFLLPVTYCVNRLDPAGTGYIEGNNYLWKPVFGGEFGDIAINH